MKQEARRIKEMKTYSQRAERDPNRAVKNPSWEAAGRRAWMRLWMVTGGKVDVTVWSEALYQEEHRRLERAGKKWRAAERSDYWS